MEPIEKVTYRSVNKEARDRRCYDEASRSFKSFSVFVLEAAVRDCALRRAAGVTTASRTCGNELHVDNRVRRGRVADMRMRGVEARSLLAVGSGKTG